MIQIKIGRKTFDKKYLFGINQFQFDGLLPLIFALFNNNNPEETVTDKTIFQYLDLCAYKSIKNIPKEELAIIENYYWHLKGVNKHDSEKSAYLLMASVLKGETLVIVDSELIENNDQTITLNFASEISFVLKDNYQHITFKTL